MRLNLLDLFWSSISGSFCIPSPRQLFCDVIKLLVNLGNSFLIPLTLLLLALLKNLVSIFSSILDFLFLLLTKISNINKIALQLFSISKWKISKCRIAPELVIDLIWSTSFLNASNDFIRCSMFTKDAIDIALRSFNRFRILRLELWIVLDVENLTELL